MEEYSHFLQNPQVVSTREKRLLTWGEACIADKRKVLGSLCTLTIAWMHRSLAKVISTKKTIIVAKHLYISRKTDRIDMIRKLKSKMVNDIQGMISTNPWFHNTQNVWPTKTM